MTLGGATFVWNGISQDYNFKETISCLIELCDSVSIVCGGDDGTIEQVFDHIKNYAGTKEVPIIVSTINKEQWEQQKGREKLSFFMNHALEMLSTDWIIAVQADEVLYDRSLPVIRHAIEMAHSSSVIMTRYNAWRDPLSMLNVEQARKPCSTEVIRLARRGHFCYGDGEHLAVPSVQEYGTIEMYHAGYVRDPKKYAVKARHMLVDIFGMQWDTRIGDELDWRKFPFEGNDIVPVPLPLPSFIVPWLQERYPDIKLV